eukprot:2122921-Rhodomonas_salina.1
MERPAVVTASISPKVVEYTRDLGMTCTLEGSSRSGVPSRWPYASTIRVLAGRKYRDERPSTPRSIVREVV